ncbi:hypothetical protein JOC78_002222 [Bacillus ectoiniformans]|uniref:hypothetical protein n=1 Tax=Bacillus ectoiniformans TaxID=1494429 RepID=UPI00195F06E2|nr:hypothetical protein [Bacillus ectoiniformans]MBM7649269.1 hypothetical protein [Bacillus ectoiniformans]
MIVKNQRKQRKKKQKKEDFGTCSFYCKPCQYEFEVEWETIWELQELTHGFVGFHTEDSFISCPKCHELVED